MLSCSPAPSAAPKATRRIFMPAARPMCAGPRPMIRRMSAMKQQRDYLFIRHNPKGLHFERWRCDRGCGKWFHAARDTVTMEFKAFYGITELPPRELMEQAKGPMGRLFQGQAEGGGKIMSNKPYRLAQGGSRIDRTKKVHFSFRRQAADRLCRRHGGLRRAWPMARSFSAAASSITARAAWSASARKK